MEKILPFIVCLAFALSMSACNKVKEEEQQFEKRGGVKMEPFDLKRADEGPKKDNGKREE